MGQLLRNSTTTAASQRAALRLDDMARFYLGMREAMDTAIHELSARKEEERQRA